MHLENNTVQLYTFYIKEIRIEFDSYSFQTAYVAMSLRSTTKALNIVAIPEYNSFQTLLGSP